MNRLERTESINEVLIAALTGWQAGLWTSMPGIIQSFDPDKKTCTVQPAIQLQVIGPALVSLSPNAPQTQLAPGQTAWMTLPILTDCPVHFPSGGGYTLTFPVAKGDECLIVLSSRCIDSWWQNGGVQPLADLRMHNLSDGFVLVGISSIPNVPGDISTDSVQLRSNAGTTVLDLTEGLITATVTTFVVNGNTVLNGNLSCSGTSDFAGASAFGATIHAVGNIFSGLIGLFTHKHTGVTTGGGTSAGPTP